MIGAPPYHVVRVYRDERYSDAFRVTDFKITDGMLILSRDNLILATYAPGDWRSFIDETQIDIFTKSDKEKGL